MRIHAVTVNQQHAQVLEPAPGRSGVVLNGVTMTPFGDRRGVRIATPDAFEGDFNVVPRRLPNGGIGYDYDARLDPDVVSLVNGVTYWVNGTTGNDANAGTESAPFQSLYQALIQPDVDCIRIAPGVYGRTAQPLNTWTHIINRSVAIINTSSSEPVYMTTREHALTWTQDGTHTNCWTTTRSGVYAVLDVTQADENGDFAEYTQAVSETACNSTPSSWFLDGSGKLFVHTHDGGAIASYPNDSDIWVLVSEPNLRITEPGEIFYFEGIHFYGSINYVMYATAVSTASRVLAKRCVFAQGTQNGVYIGGGIESVFQDCVAHSNRWDGFNYHDNYNRQPVAVEINCVGRDNGVDLNDQGSTVHDDASILRINGSYRGNTGQQIADIGTSRVWMLGCTVGGGAYYGLWADPQTTVFLDSCQFQTNSPADIYVQGGSVYHHNTAYDGSVVAHGGTLAAYDPAAPDSARASAWYRAGNAPEPIAVWDASLANDLFDSLTNLINPGTYDLTVSGVAPTWSGAGWDFSAGNGALMTGIVVPAGGAISVVVQFSNASDTSGARALFGAQNSSSNYYAAAHYWNANRVYLANRSGAFSTPAMTSGVLMVTQDAAYRNGVSVASVNGLLVESPQLAIGACNTASSGLQNYCNARIKRVAIWSAPITAAQASAIYDRLSLLG